jgi:aspartate kinase
LCFDAATVVFAYFNNHADYQFISHIKIFIFDDSYYNVARRMAMKIYKFGGASVKDANGVKNVAEIIGRSSQPLVVVISAMGKTTNALEELIEAYLSGDKMLMIQCVQRVKMSHQQIVDALFNSANVFQSQFDALFEELQQRLEKQPSLNYDYEYDQIVSFGEILSTSIVSAYINHVGLKNSWIDIRPVIKTDENYRNPAVLWDYTSTYIQQVFDFSDNRGLYITQGFLGSTINNLTTTLGREGSDYTAAILGHVLNAESVTIWKDVPGVLSADPRWYPRAQKLPFISYWEAIELTYHGAQVIHPKTLKPLQNKGIPLCVKSFIDPQLAGTIVGNTDGDEKLCPIFILKQNQLFLTISPRDFSFIVEDNLSDIFAIFGRHKLAINLMQKSALNFSVCIDKTRNTDKLLIELDGKYVIRYNDDVELVTIRHYTQEAMNEVTHQKEIIDSQITRKSARYVVKKSPWVF